jgi:hypothetical protein
VRPSKLTWIDCDLSTGIYSSSENLNAFASHLLEAGALPAQTLSCLRCTIYNKSRTCSACSLHTSMQKAEHLTSCAKSADSTLFAITLLCAQNSRCQQVECFTGRTLVGLFTKDGELIAVKCCFAWQGHMLVVGAISD